MWPRHLTQHQAEFAPIRQVPPAGPSPSFGMPSQSTIATALVIVGWALHGALPRGISVSPRTLSLGQAFTTHTQLDADRRTRTTEAREES